MSKPANKTVIGIFVVGAIALVVVAIVVLGSGKFFKKTVTAVCYFEGSVGGLNVGAPVVFRGVKVGTVSGIRLQYSSTKAEFRIPVFLELEPETIEREQGAAGQGAAGIKFFVEQGLRARLELQSIVTGQMQVGLDLYPNKPAKFVAADLKYPEIPTIPTPLQEIAKKIEKIPFEEILEKVQSTLTEIEKTVKSPEIGKTLQSVSEAALEARSMMKNVNSQIPPLASSAGETVKEIQKLAISLNQNVATLSSNIGGAVDETRGMVRTINSQVTPLASSLEGTLKETQKLVQHLDGKIDPVASNAEEVLKGLNSLAQNDVKNLLASIDRRVDQVLPAIVKNLDALQGTIEEARTALRSFEGTAGTPSPLIYQLTQTLAELSNAARALRSLADLLERNPEALIRGK